ncbi:MAG: response regulator transcription factor [Bacillota bacterium]
MARILMVDDDADFLEYASRVLQHGEHTVSTAHNGAEALQVLEADAEFDLVILDLMMEKSDEGFTLAHRVRELLGKDGRIMILTGVRRTHDLGFDLHSASGSNWIDADDFVEKPISSEDLLERIRRLVGDE